MKKANGEYTDRCKKCGFGVIYEKEGLVREYCDFCRVEWVEKQMNKDEHKTV